MRDYVIPFDTTDMQKKYADVVIIGCGIAGLYTALMLPSHMDVMIVSKGSYKETNSYLAQGGVSSSFGEGTNEEFFKDTMLCGKEESDTRAVWTMVNGAKENIMELERLGVSFDKNDKGQFLFAKEGAHSIPRIIRSGDYTGKSIMEVLYMRVQEQENIRLLENRFAVDILTHNHKSVGLLIMEENITSVIFSKYVVINTGGIGNLYPHTTNAKGIQGDGIAMVLRANGCVSNMSYVQFHPTVFYDQRGNQKQSFLISEAVRGEGALLYNEKGERFMESVHPMKELAPRDIVSTMINEEIKNQIKPYVYLDITHLGEERLQKRFPTIFHFLKNEDINMATDYIPVAPKMHYLMGGIKVNIDGQTSINGLYACGECSCTGVHGKNRLASNSLLEAIVFGKRIATHIAKHWTEEKKEINDISIHVHQWGIKIEEEEQTISNWMNQYFSIDRSVEQVTYLNKKLIRLITEAQKTNHLTSKEIEKVNAILVMNEMTKDDLMHKTTFKEERI